CAERSRWYVSRTWLAKLRGSERPKRSKSRASCARIADGPADGLTLGIRQRRSPGIVASVVGDHALGGECPEHAPDIPFHRSCERRRAKGVEQRRQTENRLVLPVAPAQEHLRLQVSQRRSHPDQGGARAHHDGVAEKAVLAGDEQPVWMLPQGGGEALKGDHRVERRD